MKPSSSIISLVGLALVSGYASAGSWSFANLGGGDDLESGIDAAKTYTHLIDFGPDTTPATINGVEFTSKGRTGSNYTLTGPGADFPNNGVGSFVDTGLGDLFGDFIYGGPLGVQTLTLNGLREAHTYRLSFFVTGWGTPAADIEVSDAPGVRTRIARDGTRWAPNPDDPEAYESTSVGNPGAIISYDYVAPASGTIVVVMDAVADGDTFHHYGFVNEQVGIPGDSDSDGMPDIYEQANGLNSAVNDAALDKDGDGVANLAEYTNRTRADNPDTDADGLSDGVETNSGTFVSATNTGSDPLNPDTDADGLPDGIESNSGTYVNAGSPGSHPLKSDTDGDGFGDATEANQGFNPNTDTSTPESKLTILTAVEFRFNAGNGVSYRIEGSADLVDWTIVEANIVGTGGTVTRFYSTENTPLRFYRAQRN